MGYFLQMRNVSGRACRIEGFAREAEALTASGAWQSFRFFHGTPLDGDYAPVAYLLQRNGFAVVDLVTSHAEGYRRVVWHGVRVLLPHLRGWITWFGPISPDSGVGLGPVRISD